MQLSIRELFIYPVKSCAGLAVRSAQVADTGFEHDREWMIVRENGWFITQRQYPRMALIRPAVVDGGVRLSAPGMPDITVPITDASAKTLAVRIWDDTLGAADQGDAAAQWLGTFLETGCRLVHLSSRRPVGQKYQRTGAESVSFADAFPFLLISQASLDDLNGRLDKPVPITRFRPNIVISGGTAFQEDGWKTIRIGGITFRVAKPCSRCEIITIDQQTAVKDVEPLETLGTYRYRTKGIMFGQNLVQDSTGGLAVGDRLAVIE